MHPLIKNDNGRYSVGGYEITSGDIIEYDNGNGTSQQARVEFVYRLDGYGVKHGNDYLPLSELLKARYVGSGRL